MREEDRASELLRSAKLALERQGHATPALDARLLLQAAAGLTREAMIADPDRPVAADAAARFRTFIDRRLKGEPVSRILGDREFYGRVFTVTPATLDPRPDTETLIDAALTFMPADRPCRFIDLGTGTGAIALTLLAERPLAEAVLTDISPQALAVARANAERLGVMARASFIEASWFAGIEGQFDLILSNPPYIPTAILPTLAPDVQDFDPRSALDGGPDGLGPYREIAARALSFLAPQGRVIVEIGEGQALEIEDIFKAFRLVPESRWKDLAGHVRCLGFTQA
ncbi:peptide chain release factor N(5)-glutamine methyltransferase [Aestuariivirga sp. YIM B02566]|uniref:Peptide chain release factor N(5)-glutamine methyltransferase n=1 Tax=Taklimakanibacter albus TaxID=2800327 RepID=A0ACC5R6A1_9HYPH|nr:peptide chain release factor N(5)-glutamine methyltransferase [Aestuariivirga sp. YIM B02566]MBK1868135.1 peptide chain release factor N(5)-glutamine methyltransferase [Aestuariivirga sp. YIM B02566]